MAERRRSPAFVGALAVLALVGCAAPAEDAVTSTQSESTPPVDPQRVHEVQAAAVANTDPDAELVSAESGTGSREWDLPALPAGTTQYGAIVNCSGAEPFEVTFEQATPSHFDSTCSMVDLVSGSYPIDVLAEGVPARIDLEPGTEFWVTFYAI